MLSTDFSKKNDRESKYLAVIFLCVAYAILSLSAIAHI